MAFQADGTITQATPPTRPAVVLAKMAEANGRPVAYVLIDHDDPPPDGQWTEVTWPDSLAAGPAAASEGAVLLLASPSGLDASPPVLAWLQARRGEVGSVRLVGGQDV